MKTAKPFIPLRALRALRGSLCLLLLAAAALPSRGADAFYKLTVVVTNVVNGITTNGTATLTINGDTRTATNIVSSNPDKLWLGTNAYLKAATNLYQHAQIKKFGSGNSLLSVRMTNANTIEFTAVPNNPISVSLGGVWGTVSLHTNLATNQIPVVVPAGTMSLETQTNVGNGLADYINKAATSIGTGVTAMANFVDRSSTQTASNKTLTHSVIQGGRVVGTTNSTGTNVAYTNVTLHLVVATGVDLSGLITALSNGTIYASVLNGVRPTNVVGLAGAVHQIIGGTWSNGTFTSATLVSPSLSNAVIFGNTTVTGASVNLIGSGANNFVSITATSTTAAVGPIFYLARENGISTAVDAADVLGIIGFTGYGATGQKVGARIRAIPMETFTDSTAGTILLFETTPSGSTTPVGRIHIGDTGFVTATNPLQVIAGTTNTPTRGTNTFSARLDFVPRSNADLGNGYNSDVILGTNVYIRLSGPSGAYTNRGFRAAAAVDGTFHIVQANNPGLSFAILNDSADDPTPANRIMTGNGSTKHSTNNPVCFSIIYDGSASRWRILDWPPN